MCGGDLPTPPFGIHPDLEGIFRPSHLWDKSISTEIKTMTPLPFGRLRHRIAALAY